jgi:drug/metabolite transporter (DMT)-like permease
VAILLGLGASIAYGAADFLGGFASKRASSTAVVLLVQSSALVMVSVIIPPLAGVPLTAEAWLWGCGAGVAGGVGAALLYRGLAVGRMGVVAPVAAVFGALVPLVAGLILGEVPRPLGLAGVVLALAAIALVSTEPAHGEIRVALRHRLRAAGLLLGVGAGLGFGAVFLLYDAAGANTGPWPVFTARVATVAMFAVVVLAGRIPVRPAAASVGAVVAVAAFSTAADTAFLVGSRLGLLPVVSVLTSLYPVTTVALARGVLKERIGPVRAVGLALAVAGVALMTVG